MVTKHGTQNATQNHMAGADASAEKQPRVGIIVGSIREGRKGIRVGRWVEALAKERGDADFQLIDLAEYDVPLLTSATVPGGANRKYDTENVRRWSRDIDACDAFIFVTAEYNHGVPGVFKNAFDSIAPEWEGKPVGFVSYGSVGGVRSVEQWRQIVATFGMVDISAQVSMPSFSEFGRDGEFTPSDRRPKELEQLIAQLLTITAKLQV